MPELEFARTDGEHLVLRETTGEEHLLAVTPPLRAALADMPTADPADSCDQEHTMPEVPPAEPEPARHSELPSWRPRDIQARLRAGATVAELVFESGLPIESIRRYEWPVLTEREHVIGMVRSHDVPGSSGASELGKLTDTRLAARGIEPTAATWSARREGLTPWIIEVRFKEADRERSARWTYDLRTRNVTPLDDEARWFSQPDDFMASVLGAVPSLAARRAQPDETDELLDDLAGRRGRPAQRHEADAVANADGPANRAQVASVVDLGRWNPRRSHERSPVRASDVHASQPALLTPSGAMPVEAVVTKDAPARVAEVPTEVGIRAESIVDEIPVPIDVVPVAGSRAAGPASRVAQIGRPQHGRLGRGDSLTGTPAVRTSSASISAASISAAGSPSVAGSLVGTPSVGAPSIAGSASAGRQSGTVADHSVRLETPGRGIQATRRRGRTQMPSWDEIVFGQRPESS
jgi:hypothetical protein